MNERQRKKKIMFNITARIMSRMQMHVYACFLLLPAVHFSSRVGWEQCGTFSHPLLDPFLHIPLVVLYTYSLYFLTPS